MTSPWRTDIGRLAPICWTTSPGNAGRPSRRGQLLSAPDIRRFLRVSPLITFRPSSASRTSGEARAGDAAPGTAMTGSTLTLTARVAGGWNLTLGAPPDRPLHQTAGIDCKVEGPSRTRIGCPAGA